MRVEDFFEALGGLEDGIVEEAGAAVKKAVGWRAWAAAAACVLVVAAAALAIPRGGPGEEESRNETVLATEILSIYYLAEDGSIESREMELRCVPEEIFNEWAALNNVEDVKFVSCEYDDNGSESSHDGVVEYRVGDYYTLTLTVSGEFSAYAGGERGELLVQTLERTFCGYVRVDSFELVIGD